MTDADYRVSQYRDGFQPEMRYVCGHAGAPREMWVPLNAAGYWVEPHVFTTGVVTKSSAMDEESARRAIWRAQLINRPERRAITRTEERDDETDRT